MASLIIRWKSRPNVSAAWFCKGSKNRTNAPPSARAARRNIAVVPQGSVDLRAAWSAAERQRDHLEHAVVDVDVEALAAAEIAGAIGLLAAKIAESDGIEVHLAGRSAASLDFARSIGLRNAWHLDDGVVPGSFTAALGRALGGDSRSLGLSSADLVEAITRFRFQGTSSKVNFALDGLPEYPALPGRGDQFAVYHQQPMIIAFEEGFDDHRIADRDKFFGFVRVLDADVDPQIFDLRNLLAVFGRL